MIKIDLRNLEIPLLLFLSVCLSGIFVIKSEK